MPMSAAPCSSIRPAGSSPAGAEYGDHHAREFAPQLPRSPGVGRRLGAQAARRQWQDGGAYALLGPSGCGKTTLLNIISGLLRPSQGRVLFDGQDVTDLRPDQRRIAGLPVPGDLRHLYDNLAFPLRNRGVAEADVDARVRQIAALLELTPTLRNRAAGLTADSKQKISLGRGLVRSDVNVIMFDEPLTVIDPHLEVGAALEAEGAPPGADAHHDLRHPRPDRGADDRRSGGHGPARSCRSARRGFSRRQGIPSSATSSARRV